jgi:hypothetical protein
MLFAFEEDIAMTKILVISALVSFSSEGDANCGSATDLVLQAKTSAAHADAKVLILMCLTSSR